MKILKAIVRTILIISVIVVVVLAIVEMPKHTCESVVVRPHTENESVVLTQNDVVLMMSAKNIKVVGKKIKDIDLEPITKMLESNPYIEKVNFVHFAGNRLMIDYKLRTVILHVFDADGNQYLVDANGQLLPNSNKMQDNLIIANGNIHQSYKKGTQAQSYLLQMVNLTKLILNDDFCKAQFRQIYLNGNHQMELIATVGKQVILFGSDANAQEKLFNLKQVYQNGITRKGYDRYAQLDVRYKNRIIAQRKL